MWRAKLAEKIGIKYPIIQAPMAGGATTPELVAGVSNAGGLGSLGAGYMSPTDIRSAIRKIRELTANPFAVNLFIPEHNQVTPSQMHKACCDIQQSCIELNLEIKPVVQPYAPSFSEQLKVLIEEKIPVFSYAFGLLDLAWISQFKKNHTILMGTATNLEEAYELEKSGIDALVAQGCEAGGHRGTFLGKAEDSLIGLFSLLPQLVDKLKIPVIAAGGIMDGRGIIAATDLGADGVQMGTAFLTCPESGIPDSYKHTLLAQFQDNTVLTRAFSGKLARGIRNKFIERMDEKKTNILSYPIQNALTTTMRKKAKEEQHIDFMSMWSGQSAQLCRNLSASELINTLLIEVESLKLKH
ncbi:NAD(P)H-dependent flavin oxidoreductase [Legionella longbeachae]|uniref:Nitronate monooxygenase n=1 Tax=Legionella longbeachae serogroup 1 (strain NSW150) TaxID=661367 RepID=D3HQG4_LEGLN|nr:nitronate monooxygenase [Legionella longbeachae]VEE01651.1 2-nitropropane dioxygenase [Legionella oakridgensis]HBD7396410.1 nitronate monooxygenase [Legionella pneumophila]ARB92010.1 nitronate monooxygenase [Legionella longbeachae]ARM34804.1 nitronate monooxygenase [Legionella longbeachae]EEZ95755.1 2-nitropropane dioxygenase family oxidoreductase [Legionella longbeachae D-4968]